MIKTVYQTVAGLRLRLTTLGLNQVPQECDSRALPDELDVMEKLRRIEPPSSRLKAGRSTTELQPHPITRNTPPQSGARQPGLSEPGPKRERAWLNMTTIQAEMQRK